MTEKTTPVDPREQERDALIRIALGVALDVAKAAAEAHMRRAQTATPPLLSPDELPAERSAEFLRWWHDKGRNVSTDAISAEKGFEAGRRVAQTATPQSEDERDETIRNLTHALREAVEGESLTSMIRRHKIKAGNCPPGSEVVLVSSLMRAAQTATTQSEAVRRPVGERIWECKIGAVCDVAGGADFPMRRAVEGAFMTITGVAPDFLFSGWGGKLTASESEVAPPSSDGRKPKEQK